MKDRTLYETPCMQDTRFPISVSACSFHKPGMAFPYHWHEHMEFIFITGGEGIISCNSTPYCVREGDLVLVNSSELHCGYSTSDMFSYSCIIVDPSVLSSCYCGVCEVNYINPILQNHIVFRNILSSDGELIRCILSIIGEREQKKPGYELSVKSFVFALLARMLREHASTTISSREYEGRKRELERLEPVINHIERNYRENLSAEELSRIANLSRFHFSRLFKKLTGKTVTDYVNSHRMNVAASLLSETGMSVTEVALAAGFSDVNYFSRLFKQQKKVSPTLFRRNGRQVNNQNTQRTDSEPKYVTDGF